MNKISDRRATVFKSIIKTGLRAKILLLLKGRGRTMRIVSQVGLITKFKLSPFSIFVTSSIFNYRFSSTFFLGSKNVIRFWVY